MTFMKQNTTAVAAKVRGDKHTQRNNRWQRVRVGLFDEGIVR